MRSVAQLADLHGRTAVLSGGAGHLGRACAGALAGLGASVALVDLDEDEVRAAAAVVGGEHGVPSLGLACDIRDREAVAAVPGRVADALGGVDVVVNLASLVGTTEGLRGWGVPFDDQDVGTFAMALDVGLVAAFALTQAASPWLRSSGHGAVVNVASIYGVVGPDMGLYEGTAMGNPAGYAAAKGGLIQLTRWLSTVLAPEVRVNAVSPGGILRGQPGPFVERYVARTPLGRMGSEEDVVGSVAFLASDLSAYVTGQNLLVDGGWTAW